MIKRILKFIRLLNKYSKNILLNRRIYYTLRKVKRFPLPTFPGKEWPCIVLPDCEPILSEAHLIRYDSRKIGTYLDRRPVGSPRYLVSIDGFRSFFSENFLVIDKRYLIYDLNIDNSLLLSQNSARQIALGSLGIDVRRLTGNVCYLSNTSITNYFHWMIFTLPLLHYYLKYSFQPNYIYVCEKNIPNFVFETLEKAEISRSSIVQEPCTGTSNIMAISHYGLAGRKEAYLFVRNLFSSSLSQNAARARRIFVDRGDTFNGRRKLKNNFELSSALESNLGFQRVTMDGLSVEQQANIFYNAEIIVAPHGAALANLIFCHPNTKVIELFSPNYMMFFCIEIMEAMGIIYKSVIGEVDRDDRIDQYMSLEDLNYSRDADFTVKVDVVVAMASQLMELEEDE